MQKNSSGKVQRKLDGFFDQLHLRGVERGDLSLQKRLWNGENRIEIYRTSCRHAVRLIEHNFNRYLPDGPRNFSHRDRCSDLVSAVTR